MDPGYSRAHSPSNIPTSSSKFHHPYFTPAEVDYLSEKQRGKLSVTQEDKIRQNACGFLEALGVRIGLYVHYFLSRISIAENALLAPEEPSEQRKTCITDFTCTFRGKTSTML
jgi:hypothetical protein